MNDARKNRIKEIIRETLTTFGKNYAMSTMLVIKDNKEKEIEEQEEEEKKAELKVKKQKHYWEKNHEGEEFPGIPEGEPTEKDATYAQIEQYQILLYKAGLKAHRPRPKGNKSRPMKIIARISYYQILDSDTDPYCVYYVKANYGKMESAVYHRYSDFKTLNKKLKGFIPKDIKIPDPSSSFGSRNLKPEFLQERVKSLNKYLEQVSEVDKIEENKEFLNFLDLSIPENPLDKPIFERALKRTKWDIHSWGELIYDTEEVGICRLICGKIHREMWWEIEKDLPPQPIVRKPVVKGIYRVINSSVNAAVPPAWKTTYSASKPVRETIEKNLSPLIGKVVDMKKNITDKLNDGMADAFKPIKEAISDSLSKVLVEVIPLIVKTLSPIIKLFTEIIEPSVIKAIDQGDKDELEEIAGYFKKKSDDIKGKLQEALDNVVDGICKGITIPIDVLLDLFSPIRSISRIIHGLLEMMDPDNFVQVLKLLLKLRDNLKNQSSITDPELRNKLDKIESEVSYSIWRNGLPIGWGASNARWYLYYCGMDLGQIPDIIYDTGYKIKKFTHKRTLKKFARRFTDHVWEATIDQTNTPWETVVDLAFKMAYNSAKKCFLKSIGDIIKDLCKRLLNSAVLDKVIDKIKGAIETILDPIDSAIPENLKEFVNITEILTTCVEDTLTNAFSDIIDDQGELFANEFNNACA